VISRRPTVYHRSKTRTVVDKRHLIERSDIGAVWRALGGGELRHGRGRAFWRDGDGYNVALDDTTGYWRDFAWGEGGGIIALIERALGCSRTKAWQWLTAHHGVELDRLPRDQARKQRLYLRRVEAAAVSLQRLRREITGCIRAVRNWTWSDCRDLDAWATKQGGFTDDPGWKEVAQVPDRMRIADGIDEYIHELENMSAHELIEMRKRLNRRVSCQKT
jgi:hypothetical protein